LIENLPVSLKGNTFPFLFKRPSNISKTLAGVTH